MKHTKSIITLAFLLIVATAFAQAPRMGYGMNRQQPRNNYNCNLTSDEWEKTAEVKRDFEKKAIPLRSDIRVLRMELDELIADGKSNKEIDAKFDELNAAREKLAKARLDHQVNVRNVIGEDRYKQTNRYYMQGRCTGNSGRNAGRKSQGFRTRTPNAFGEGGRQYYRQPVVK